MIHRGDNNLYFLKKVISSTSIYIYIFIHIYTIYTYIYLYIFYLTLYNFITKRKIINIR